MEDLLDEIRARMGQAPRKWGPLARWQLRVRPPRWMPREDALMEVFRRQLLLLTEGQVLWRALVQANSLLFEVGRHDCPAFAVYCTGCAFDACPERLQAIGQQLFALKNTTPKILKISASQR
jgi:hypothetical protein